MSEPNKNNSIKNRTIFIFLILFLIVAGGVGLRFLHQANDITAYKIGAILPFSGPAKSYGEWMRNGMQLAELQVNQNKKDVHVQVVFADSESKVDAAERSFKRLIDIEKVDTAATTLTPVSTALIALADKQQIPIFTSAISPGLVDNSIWAFRNSANVRTEVEGLFKAISPNLKIKTLGLIYNNNAVGQWLKDNLGDIVKEYGISLVETVSYEKGETNFQAQVQKLKEASPDAIYLYGYGELGLVAKKIYEMGLKTQLLGGLDMELPEFIETGKEAVENAIYARSSYDINDPNPVSKQFVDSYRKKFNADPDVYSAVHFDMVLILSNALRAAGNDREKLRAYISNISDFQGASGITSFGKTGDAIKPVQVKTIKNGQHVLYKK